MKDQKYKSSTIFDNLDAILKTIFHIKLKKQYTLPYQLKQCNPDSAENSKSKQMKRSVIDRVLFHNI